MGLATQTVLSMLAGLVFMGVTVASEPMVVIRLIPRSRDTMAQSAEILSGLPAAREGDNKELTVDFVVEQVLARNPTLAQMNAAWEAANARYPQVTSLDDPQLSGMVSPVSFGSKAVEPGYRLELSQKLPFPGKRRLKGDSALAEASAAGFELDDTRVQLVETARLAFYDYFLVSRAIAVNEESLRLLRVSRGLARERYETNQAPQQDYLLADVEIGRRQERGLNLERMRKVATARLNTLMHLPPVNPLPAPPRQLAPGEALRDVESLHALALERRPDLKALADRINAEQAALSLALREYCPDVEATAAYDTIMGNGPARDLAAQVGLRINLPVRKARRGGAVSEAQARIAQRQAERDSRMDQIRFQVQEAYEQLVESEKILQLYDITILPAADENVRAARSAYTTNKVPFLSLLESQRNRVNLRDRYYEAMADYFRRRATLERVMGGPLPAREMPPVPQPLSPIPPR